MGSGYLGNLFPRFWGVELSRQTPQKRDVQFSGAYPCRQSVHLHVLYLHDQTKYSYLCQRKKVRGYHLIFRLLFISLGLARGSLAVVSTVNAFAPVT